MTDWPSWWQWDLEVSPHALKRMADRDFTEIDLRRMLELATGIHADVMPGRWRIAMRLRRRSWEVIVEPDDHTERVVVITAYPASP